MIVKLIKPAEGIEYDITQAVETITWSGSIIGAARTVDFNYINAPYDPGMDLPKVSTGDFLSLFDGDELFFGQIFGIEKSTETGTLTYTAQDAMKNLLESNGYYNFKNMAPEAIAEKVLADIQVPFNNLAVTGVNIKSMLCDGTSYYDIILGAYTQAYRMTGKRYLPMIWHRAFGVWEAIYTVGNYTLSDESNITLSSLSESMDEIKNQIKIYNSSGKQVGEVKDDPSIQTYGTFQDIYTVEDGVDPNAAAGNMLKTVPTQEISVEAIGDLNCLSGYSVEVSDGATGLSGKYWITSDSHTWSGGIHTMQLDLRFEQIMDEKDITEEEAKK